MVDDVEPGDSENILKKKKMVGWEVGPRGKGYMYICLIFFFVQQKLTQHCKLTVC